MGGHAGLVAAVLCLATSMLSACGVASGESRKLVWADEFHGPAGQPPDRSKWRDKELTDPCELQCYTDAPANVATGGKGHLVIRALKQPGHCADGWLRDYTSGRLSTERLYTWTHGRLEIRAKVPSGVGTWPAFWALGANKPEVEWPRSGEIDVMEYVPRLPHELIGTVHFPTKVGEHTFLQAKADLDAPLSGRFHVYAVDWSSEALVWSLDGREYGRVTREEVERDGDWVFDRPFYLTLNLALGGKWGGAIPESTAFPQEFVVDYVRVYQ